MTQDANSCGDTKCKHPALMHWAQRNNVVYLTFKVESCRNPKVSFEKHKVTFTGEDSTVQYGNDVEVYEEIKPEGCTWVPKGPAIECTLQKQAIGFWPRLLKTKEKCHHLKVDFNKWVDEDDEDDVEESKDGNDDMDLSQMMAQMGGGAGMPGMPGMDGLDDEDEDSDDEDLPDLEEAPDCNHDNA